MRQILRREAIAHSAGVPTCSCGGRIKPDVVLYEEGLNEDTLYKAVRYIAEADVLIIAGTSLAVYPAAGLVNYSAATSSSSSTRRRWAIRPARIWSSRARSARRSRRYKPIFLAVGKAVQNFFFSRKKRLTFGVQQAYNSGAVV